MWEVAQSCEVVHVGVVPEILDSPVEFDKLDDELGWFGEFDEFVA